MEQLVDEAQKAYARELFERAVRNKRAVAAAPDGWRPDA
ncbi:hypothetical protein SEA_MISSDAISY_76 [Mycobacterium phage MissDaisy]|nr:hypothetical protein SEA_MISSDAISY_76 [Mycobacterium phage MissDaisy]